MLVLLAGAVFTGWKYYEERKPGLESEQQYEELRQHYRTAGNGAVGEGAENFSSLDFEGLQSEFPDVVSWITGPGTVIDYPVVQGEDNDFYLEHLADGTPNRNGAIFMDYRNQPSDTLTVLYGHHIRGGRMFTPLEAYKSQQYYEEHPVLYYETPEKRYELRLFAGVVTDGSSEQFSLKMDEGETKEWIRSLQSRSDFQADWEPDPGGSFMALCTCTYDYSNARYVVYGQLFDAEGEHDEK